MGHSVSTITKLIVYLVTVSNSTVSHWHITLRWDSLSMMLAWH